MHQKITLPSELLADLDHPIVTAEAILAAADTPVEDLQLEVEPLPFPDAAFTDFVQDPGLPHTPATPRASQGVPEPSSRTAHITIRVPARILAAYKQKAAKLGIGYQTLIVRTLRDAA